MEVHPWLICATALLASTILVIFKLFHLRRSPINLPPGPKPWPIIGNLNLISPLPHLSLHELSQKYGPIMQLQFGSFPVVVGSSVEMAKQFLKIHDVSLASRPKSAAGKYTTYENSDVVWAPYGPYWRHARKIFNLELFNMKTLASNQYIREEELNGLLHDLYASSGEPITLRVLFSNFTLNNITRIVLGKKFPEKSESEEFKKMADEWFFLNGAANIGDVIPWINFLDLQGYVKRMKALSKRFDPFLEKEINEHIAKRDDRSQGDMLDVLLQSAENPNTDVKLSRDNVKSLMQDLLLGGTETSTTTTEWVISELLKKPKVFERATEELDRVVGRNRWVEEKDIPNLPYIRAILYETMRIHPVSPLLTPRFARENCNVDGYDILKGTQVLVNIWSIGKDPTLWDAPNEFRPERFIGKDIDVKGQHFELLPFGSGRRMCPGYTLGLKLMESGLANLLHGFTWKLPDQMKPEDLNMEEVWGLTVPKKVPLIVVAQPRLPPDVYAQLQ